MMEVLADGGWLLELFLNRSGYVDTAEKLFQAWQFQEIKLHVIEKCLSDIQFYMSQPDAQLGEDVVSKVRELLGEGIVPVGRCLIEEARQSPLKDFDSAVELAYATQKNLVIVTLNPDNFMGAKLPVLSIDELLQRQNLEEILEKSIPPVLLVGELFKIQHLDRILHTRPYCAGIGDFQLRGRDLSGKNLSHAKLEYADLRRANLRYADLSNADLTKADLRHADLSNADLTKADLTLSDLSYANLSSANLQSADLENTNLSSVNLRSARLVLTNLTHANLNGAELCSSNLMSANLYQANLRGANLLLADLCQADLREADLRQADLREANLHKALLEKTIFGYRPEISRTIREDLMRRGAVFENTPSVTPYKSLSLT